MLQTQLKESRAANTYDSRRHQSIPSGFIAQCGARTVLFGFRGVFFIGLRVRSAVLNGLGSIRLSFFQGNLQAGSCSRLWGDIHVVRSFEKEDP